MKNIYSTLKVIFGIGLILSFFSFGLTGFLTVNGGCSSGTPFISWIFFAIFMILLGVVSSKEKKHNGDHVDWDGYKKNTHQVNYKCPLCGAINEEKAKYCNQCGERM